MSIRDGPLPHTYPPRRAPLVCSALFYLASPQDQVGQELLLHHTTTASSSRPALAHPLDLLKLASRADLYLSAVFSLRLCINRTPPLITMTSETKLDLARRHLVE